MSFSFNFNFDFDFSDMRMERLHPMDDAGTAVGTVVASCGDQNHVFVVSPWWDNDGTTGEILSCSCGFSSRSFSGYGAWQAGHDGPPEEHVFDETHAALREAAAEWERAQPWLEEIFESEELYSESSRGWELSDEHSSLPPDGSWDDLMKKLLDVKDPGLFTDSDFE